MWSSRGSRKFHRRYTQRKERKNKNLWKRWKHHPIFCVYGTSEDFFLIPPPKHVLCVLSCWQTLSGSFKSILFNFTAWFNNKDGTKWKFAHSFCRCAECRLVEACDVLNLGFFLGLEVRLRRAGCLKRNLRLLSLKEYQIEMYTVFLAELSWSLGLGPRQSFYLTAPHSNRGMLGPGCKLKLHERPRKRPGR